MITQLLLIWLICTYSSKLSSGTSRNDEIKEWYSKISISWTHWICQNERNWWRSFFDTDIVSGELLDVDFGDELVWGDSSTAQHVSERNSDFLGSDRDCTTSGVTFGDYLLSVCNVQSGWNISKVCHRADNFDRLTVSILSIYGVTSENGLRIYILCGISDTKLG